MKNLIIIALSLFAFGALAQTNQPATSTVQQITQTNLNQVMIEMLSGVKDASHEIYGASKTMIKKSIDFATEQAPDVVRQFIVWRLCNAIIWIGIWFVVISIFLWFAHRFHKWEATADPHCGGADIFSWREIAVGFKWIMTGIACFFLLFGVGSETFELVKIKVAPKVYIIEYVVGLVQGNPNQH